MSEKQAKRERKELTHIEAPKKKADKGNVLMTVIAVLVIVAIAALGVWATWDKIAAGISAGETNTAETAPVQTVADLAESEGQSVEELLLRCGLADSGITGETSQEEFFTILTVENYANYQGKTADELKAEYGIEDVANDTLWQDAQMQMPMSKVAEQMGMTFEEFAKQNSFPAEITADMPQIDAITLLQQQAAAENAEAPAEAEVEVPAEGEEAPAEETEE